MIKSDTRLIGTLAKLHSFKGRFVLISETSISEDIENWESVFLEIEGLLVPFFIDFVNLTSENASIIGFEEIDSSDIAKDYVHCDVYQLKSLAEEQEDKEESKHFSGYLIIDQKTGVIGKVDRMLDYNHNLLFRVLNGQSEILIPINENVILKTDHKKKEILINLPEGLLDLNP